MLARAPGLTALMVAGFLHAGGPTAAQTAPRAEPPAAASTAARPETLAQAEPQTAEGALALVRGIYANYVSDAAMRRWRWNTPAQWRRLFVPEIVQRLAAAEREDDMLLSADPFVNSQDPEPRRTAVTLQETDGTRAIVWARWPGGQVRYTLVLVRGGWRIQDMEWPGSDMTGTLRRAIGLPR